MKKNFTAGILLAVLTICSCSHKKAPVQYKTDIKKQQYIFEQLLKDRVPPAFKRIMLRPVIQNGKTLYLFETLYPDCMGIYDSSGFYSGECDDASWVEELLFFMEEQRYGEELLSLLEDEENIMSPITEETLADETEEEAPAVEKYLINAYGKLSILEFGNERFIPQTKDSGNVLVHYADNLAVRYFYDELLRLVKKEHWKMVSVQDSSLTSTELYEYEKNARTASKKIIENDSSRLVSILNENGLVIRAEQYSKGQENKPDQLMTRTEWKYDEKNRIIQELVTSHKYNDKGKVNNKSEKKQIFYYNKVDEAEETEKLSPDYELYENGKLKNRVVYEAKGKYTVLIVFDEHNSVVITYNNYVKTKERYITDGEERRVRNYEQ